MTVSSNESGQSQTVNSTVSVRAYAVVLKIVYARTVPLPRCTEVKVKPVPSYSRSMREDLTVPYPTPPPSDGDAASGLPPKRSVSTRRPMARMARFALPMA